MTLCRLTGNRSECQSKMELALQNNAIWTMTTPGRAGKTASCIHIAVSRPLRTTNPSTRSSLAPIDRCAASSILGPKTTFLHLMRLQCISAFLVARQSSREDPPQLGGCRYPCRHRSVSQFALGCTAIPGREDRDKSRSCTAIMEKRLLTALVVSRYVLLGLAIVRLV